MPRPSKRKLQSRAAAASLKRTRTHATTEEVPTGEPSEGQLSSSSSSCLTGGESDSEIEVSDAEDSVLPVRIGQPKIDWKEAERGIFGRSKTNAGKTPQSAYYYRKKEEKAAAQKAQLQGTYGDISRFFNPPKNGGPSVAVDKSLDPIAETPQSPLRPHQDDFPPLSSTMCSVLEPAAPEFLTPALDFEYAFFNFEDFGTEIRELDKWLKENKEKVAGDWQKRLQGVRDLLVWQGSFQYLSTEIAKRRTKWIEYSESIAVRLSKGPKFAQQLRRWERDWFETRSPPPCPMKGRHVKRQSLFNDEGAVLAVREYLNTAMWNASPQGICDAVKAHLQSNKMYDVMRIDTILHNKDTARNDLKTGICERTAQRWLVKLGWSYGRNKKGYCDGHEREDVVQYREQVFCPRMKEIFVTLREYDDNGELSKPLPVSTKRRHLVTHDESTFNANDSSSYSWKKKGSEWLKPKSRGKGLMVSEFLCAAHGRLSYFDEDQNKSIYATEIIKYGSGKGDDGWWNAEKMVEQIKKAIEIFNKAFPDDIAVFAFDNSSGHACKAKEALVAARMNLGPGGKQPTMRPTTLRDGTDQSMVYQPGDCEWNDPTRPISVELIGKPKGMKRVLQERGLWRDGLKKQCERQKKEKSHFSGHLFEETMEEYNARTADRCEAGKDCCALRILEAEPDFANEKSLLETVIVEAGHEAIFYPKFHCELNYIEYYWAALKKYTRDHCKYSFAELEKTVCEAMDSVSLKTIRRLAERSKRWMMAYMNGLTPEQREYAEKQYKSHRREYRQVFV